MIEQGNITGLVLAGGRGTRMGGLDKGLQAFRGTPLALNALVRLQAQSDGLVGPLLLNANRNLDAYRAFGHPVHPDTVPDFAGPLAGMQAGLLHCATPYLLVVPCDTPLFPLDLAPRLATALTGAHADVAMVSAREGDETLRPQPVFCLLRTRLLPDLDAFIRAGGRKTGEWLQRHAAVTVPFDQPGDDPLAFFNANTLAELQSLEGE